MVKNTLGKVLLASSLLVVLFVLGQGIYYSPTKEATQEIQLSPREEDRILGSIVANTEKPAVTTIDAKPSRLLIPKIEVDAEVEHLGITANGNMAAPDGFDNVSWYKYGPVPGSKGSAVMAGHDNGKYVPGVFRNLHEVEVGDDVYVVQNDGERLHFRVVEKSIYPYEQAPLERIFATNDKTRLNLITCTGEWLPELKMSDSRLVIYTELVEG